MPIDADRGQLGDVVWQRAPTRVRETRKWYGFEVISFRTLLNRGRVNLFIAIVCVGCMILIGLIWIVASLGI